jgi:hypothetical protein
MSPDTTKRVVTVAGSVLVTGLLGYLAFALGSWGFDYRRNAQHRTRLERLLGKQPTLDQVVRGLTDEGSPLVDSPGGDAQLRRAAALRGGARAEEVLAKGARWPQTRVFVAGDMVYFIYFDQGGVMKDFTCVSR